MTSNKVNNQSGDHKYFIVTPQLVWALCDGPYEYTLWNVIKMIAGDSGECMLSTDDLAAAAMMSTGKASQCRETLLEQGLLEGEVRRDPGYPQPVWHLTIPDLWKANIEWRERHQSLKDRIELKRKQKSLHQMKPSPDEGGTSPDEGGTSPRETKKNHVEPEGEPKEPPSADSPPADGEWSAEVVALGEDDYEALARKGYNDAEIADIQKTKAMFEEPKPRERHTAEECMAGTQRALEKFSKNGNGRAGVADPTQDDEWIGPAKEFSALIVTPDVPDNRLRMWAGDIKAIVDDSETGKGAAETSTLIRSIAMCKDYEWLRACNRPTHQGFVNALLAALWGQALPERERKGGSSTPRTQRPVESYEVTF